MLSPLASHGITWIVLAILLGILATNLPTVVMAALLWTAASFAAVGLAYLCNSCRIFGKRHDGTLAPANVVALAPFLLFTGSVWHLARLLSREPAISTVTPRLRLARRLLPRELPADIDLVLDLTAEFPATTHDHNYLSLPILDGGVPDPTQLRATLAAIPPDATTLIHCAQGHGRTALVAACLLIQRDNLDAPAAIAAVLTARPNARMNAAQRAFLDSFAGPFVAHEPHGHPTQN